MQESPELFVKEAYDLFTFPNPEKWYDQRGIEVEGTCLYRVYTHPVTEMQVIEPLIYQTKFSVFLASLKDPDKVLKLSDGTYTVETPHIKVHVVDEYTIALLDKLTEAKDPVFVGELIRGLAPGISEEDLRKRDILAWALAALVAIGAVRLEPPYDGEPVEG